MARGRTIPTSSGKPSPRSPRTGASSRCQVSATWPSPRRTCTTAHCLVAFLHALTDETLIAELEFDRTGEQRYVARLRTGDFCTELTFDVPGEQWRVDAQFLKWKYWASLLGIESQYRLERIEGRYRSVADQNEKPTLAHELAPPSAIDSAVTVPLSLPTKIRPGPTVIAPLPRTVRAGTSAL